MVCYEKSTTTTVCSKGHKYTCMYHLVLVLIFENDYLWFDYHFDDSYVSVILSSLLMKSYGSKRSI